jgi:hypothetical protein
MLYDIAGHTPWYNLVPTCPDDVQDYKENSKSCLFTSHVLVCTGTYLSSMALYSNDDLILRGHSQGSRCLRTSQAQDLQTLFHNKALQPFLPHPALGLILGRRPRSLCWWLLRGRLRQNPRQRPKFTKPEKGASCRGGRWINLFAHELVYLPALSVKSALSAGQNFRRKIQQASHSVCTQT